MVGVIGGLPERLDLAKRGFLQKETHPEELFALGFLRV